MPNRLVRLQVNGGIVLAFSERPQQDPKAAFARTVSLENQHARFRPIVILGIVYTADMDS
jgi:hypothetical protein